MCERVRVHMNQCLRVCVYIFLRWSFWQPAAKNTDEIDIDDDDDEEEDGKKGLSRQKQLGQLEISEKAAPASLYGALLQEGEEPQGALARFRSQQNKD